MNTEQCLFGSESNYCNGRKLEHIIQASLGGSLTSDAIICAACNQYFGDHLDEELGDVFWPILQLLAPLIPGDLRNKRTRGITTNGDEVWHLPGGITEIASSVFYDTKEGKTVGLFPDRMKEKDALGQIWAKYRTRNIEPSSASRAELQEKVRPVHETALTGNALRAAVCDLLELWQLAHLRHSFLPSPKEPALSGLRGLVRQTTGDHTLLFSFADLRTDIASLFAPADFAHRMVIAYCGSRQLLTMTATFAETLPFHYQFHITLPSGDFSIGYMKALVGGADETFVRRSFAWSDDQLCRQFGWSDEGLTIASQRFFESFHAARRRALYLLDMVHDDNLLSHLRESAPAGANANEAVLELLASRYVGHQSAGRIREQLTQMVSRDIRDDEILAEYRRVLLAVVSTFGMPEWNVPPSAADIAKYSKSKAGGKRRTCRRQG